VPEPAGESTGPYNTRLILHFAFCLGAAFALRIFIPDYFLDSKTADFLFIFHNQEVSLTPFFWKGTLLTNASR